MRFRLLHRYVLFQLLAVFSLSLLAITLIFVIFGVVAEALRHGLTPRQIVMVLPYLVPETMPYTVPVTTLFSVVIVYGRMASDNEINAIKASGVHVATVIWPAWLLGLALSGVTYYLQSVVIPDFGARFEEVVMGNLKDLFFARLRRDREIDEPGLGWQIVIQRLDGEVLVRPRFHRKAPGKDGTETAGWAERATVHFDFEARRVRAYPINAFVRHYKTTQRTLKSKAMRVPAAQLVPAEHADPTAFVLQLLRRGQVVQGPKGGYDLRTRAVTQAGWLVEPVLILKYPEDGTPRLTVSAEHGRIGYDAQRKAFLMRLTGVVEKRRSIGVGDTTKQWIDFPWKALRPRRDPKPRNLTNPEILHHVAKLRAQPTWSTSRQQRKIREFQFEYYHRVALAVSCFLFVWVGSPVGIWAQRRDYLSAFGICFLPIILVYYPLTIGGRQMASGGMLAPWLAPWLGNVVLALVGLPLYRVVFKH